jgi:hypothetical protein
VNCYDRQGNPLTIQQMAVLFEDNTYKIVEKTDVGDVLVSTVWLGFDHGWGGAPPLIFETMTFPDGELIDRYSTEDEARKGHAAAVAQVKG